MKVTIIFKPNTDDMREAASIVIIDQLVSEGADVIAYDPIAMEKAKEVLNPKVRYSTSIEEALQGVDCAFIVTEWEQIKQIDLEKSAGLMKNPVFFDGRNCFKLEQAKAANIDYISMGRPVVMRSLQLHEI